MTPYDAAMIGGVVAGMIWGALRGITWQVASMASLVLGYLLAYPLSAQLAPHFPGEAHVARALALMAAYAGIATAVFFAAWLVRATLHRWKFEAFDRHLGMILGGIEGAFLGLVVTVFVVSLAPKTRDPIFGSPTGKVVGRTLCALEPVMPAEIHDVLSPFWSNKPIEEPRNIANAEEAPNSMISSEPTAADPASTDPLKGAGAALDDLVQKGTSRVGRAIVKAPKDELDRTNK